MLLDNPVLLQLKRQSEEARKAAGLPPLKYEEDEDDGKNKDDNSRKRKEGKRANGGERHDKDYRKILNHLNTEFSRLGKPFRWYFSQPSVPRGLPVADLLAAASEQGIEGKGYEKVKDAIADLSKGEV